MHQHQPEPGWYPDPAGSDGVRWWDGYGWTEHVAMPEPEVEDNLVYLDVARMTAPERLDDGLLHPRPRDEVFVGAPRGPIDSIPERQRIDASLVQGLLGFQVLGALSVTLLCGWLVVSGVLNAGNGIVVGTAAVFAVLIPLMLRTLLQLQARSNFWIEWCATRGFEPGLADGPGKLLPNGLDRSPLFGPLDQRVVEFIARRPLAGRRMATVGSLLRVVQLGELEERPPRTPALFRTSFVVMPIPEVVAARWLGASIRADHHAHRPPMMRAMLGPLVANGIVDAKAHLAAAQGQDPAWLLHVGDARLEQYLADHPLDIDIVGDLLVVMHEGPPTQCDVLDELCRDALLLHDLLVAEHELPAITEAAPKVAMPSDDEPVIDLTREGWGEASQQMAA